MKTAETESNYLFGTEINGTGKSGIVDLSKSPPELLCFCSKESSEIILESLNALASQDKWVSAEPPKDGSKIIRWHKLQKSPLIVFYKKGFSPHKGCDWVTIDCSNSYPEESFEVNIFKLAPSHPKEK